MYGIPWRCDIPIANVLLTQKWKIPILLPRLFWKECCIILGYFKLVLLCFWLNLKGNSTCLFMMIKGQNLNQPGVMILSQLCWDPVYWNRYCFVLKIDFFETRKKVFVEASSQIRCLSHSLMGMPDFVNFLWNSWDNDGEWDKPLEGPQQDKTSF